MIRLIPLFLVFFVIISCANKPEKIVSQCSDGRTMHEGSCVSQDVVDYVSCVRAQGANLGSDKRNSISVAAGTFAVQASAAREVSEKLEKKYSASDEAVMAIIQQCNLLAGISTVDKVKISESNINKPKNDAAISGRWSYSSGRGEAEIIENDGNNILIHMSFKPNRAPRPHYKVELKKKGEFIEGTWVCLIAGFRGCGVTNEVKFKVDPSGLSMSVVEGQDPHRHGITRGFTLYKM